MKNNAVRVSGTFNAEHLKRKLLCQFPKIIKCIDIIEPKPKPKPDENKEKFMKKCEERYEEIAKCVEKCKKECEEKYREGCWEKFNCSCKCKGKCSCDCKGKEPPKDPPKEPVCPRPLPTPVCPRPPPTPVCPWPPQVTTVCCASPCPCFVAWSNNYQCCSCGVVSWPGWGGPGWGSGHSSGGRPPLWGCEPGRPPKWDCEPCRPPNIVFESTPPCSIM